MRGRVRPPSRAGRPHTQHVFEIEESTFTLVLVYFEAARSMEPTLASEAPQLADVERAREAEAVTEVESAIEAGDEHGGDPKQQVAAPTNDFLWYGDDEEDPLADQYLHQSSAAGGDNDYFINDAPLADNATASGAGSNADSVSDLDLDQQLLVEIRSPTSYFYGQMPDPTGEQRTWGQYVDSFGTAYDGLWKNFQYDGAGGLHDPVERTVFVGLFQNSQRNGRGWLQYLDDGTTISATFNDTDASSGTSAIKGTIRYPNGDVYAGGIKGRLMHGRGFLIYKSGDWLGLISNDFEDGMLNGGQGIVIDVDSTLLHHATFSAGVEENTVEIDETLGLYTFEEVGLDYEDLVALAVSGGMDSSGPFFRTESFDHLNDLYFGANEPTPNWREWDLVDWLVVGSALGLLTFCLKPAMFLRIMRLLSHIPRLFLRIMFVDEMMAHQQQLQVMPIPRQKRHKYRA